MVCIGDVRIQVQIVHLRTHVGTRTILVGGMIRLVNSVSERDLDLLNGSKRLPIFVLSLFKR